VAPETKPLKQTSRWRRLKAPLPTNNAASPRSRAEPSSRLGALRPPPRARSPPRAAGARQPSTQSQCCRPRAPPPLAARRARPKATTRHATSIQTGRALRRASRACPPNRLRRGLVAEMRLRARPAARHRSPPPSASRAPCLRRPVAERPHSPARHLRLRQPRPPPCYPLQPQATAADLPRGRDLRRVRRSRQASRASLSRVA
jgi:hypothetical protein